MSVISRPLSITISNQHSCILLQHLMLSQPDPSACNYTLNHQLIFFWCCFFFAIVKHYAGDDMRNWSHTKVIRRSPRLNIFQFKLKLRSRMKISKGGTCELKNNYLSDFLFIIFLFQKKKKSILKKRINEIASLELSNCCHH